MAGFKEFDQYDALGLAQLVQAGQVNPLELLEESIARTERVNPRINAVIRPMYDISRKRGEGAFDGPFAGVPFLLKDLIASFAGVEMSNGSRFYQGFVPAEDSEYVKRFKRAGLNIFGKTNTPEFGITPSTEPELSGPSRNPWDPLRSPGGSSGGAAAAVAAGIVPMASASDGGGSIRIPASCCGLFGLKPTRGRVPSGPDQADGWFGFIAEHVISRSVRDSAHMLDAIQGNYPGQLMRVAPPAHSYASALERKPKKLRIAYSTDPALGETLHPDCKQGVLDTVKLLESLGHVCEEVKLPIQREEFIYAYSVLICSEMAATVAQGERLMGKTAKAADFEARTWALAKLGKSFSGGDVAQALWTLDQFSRQWMTYFEPYDALLTSTLGDLPIHVGGLRPTSQELIELKALAYLPIGFIAKQKDFVLKAGRRIYNYCSQTIPANVTGQPSMSVPLHWNAQHIPVGMMFTGRWGEEDVLFNLAAQLEQAKPWFDRRAPIHASHSA
ncbi:amidase family protein [Limnobacter humi]|uniref:Amidase family protein n=1 Tax=Limnobacter humi TaxID=1778671 RepID=A0ABT1WIC6_9BURK|nr:amidase family protein [Limnobacter humi]MCQ8897260.1 amidase family protein [Limnobacter humi]